MSISQIPSSIRNRFDHPGIPLLITAVVYAAFILLRLSYFSFDPSVFITAGDRFINPDFLPHKIIVLEKSAGYDGQFYYRLALDPFTSKAEDFGVKIDGPAYRHQRILYPFLVWLASFGHSAWVPFIMVGVNFCALCFIGWFGGMYSQSMNRHALWGLFFSLYPGFLLSLARDMTEILEICFLFAGLLLIRKGRQLLAAVFFTLAILTKETALLMIAGIFFSWLLSRKKGRGNAEITWYLFVIPGLSYVCWQGILFLHWGQISALSGGNQIGIPLVGIVDFVLSNFPVQSIYQAFLMGEFLFVIFFTAGVILSFGSSSALKHEKYSWIAYGALMAILTNTIWLEDWGFFRALSDFYLLGAIIVLGSKPRIRQLIFLSSIIVWGCIFLREFIWALLKSNGCC